MGRPKIPDEQKQAEGAFVKARFEQMCELEDALTQEALGVELSVSQGLIGQWFSGKTSIPDRSLIFLGGRLGFDPFELRPELGKYFYSGLGPRGRQKTISTLVKRLIESDDKEFQRLSSILFAYLGESGSQP